MDFLTLDSTLNVIKQLLNVTNIQWRRRYYEYGQFEIQMIESEYDIKMKYIWNRETNELAFINKVVFETKSIGNFVSISGYFIEQILEDYYPPTLGYGYGISIETLCHNIVENSIGYTRIGLDDTHYESKDRIPIVKGTSVGNSTINDEVMKDTDSVGSQFQTLLKSIQEGQKLRFDYTNRKFYYDTYQGRDRSVEGENFVLFSDSLNNLKDIEYSNDDSDYKNYARVYYTLLDDSQTYIDVNLMTNTYDKRMIVIECMEKGDTDDDTKKMAQQKGTLELLNHTKIVNASFTPVTDSYKYLVDFDLGDKIMFNSNIMGISYSERIVGVNEIYKKGQRTLQLLFGNEKKMLYKRGRY